MPTITTRDGTEIFYKDWGSGQPILFAHGWPLSSDAWDNQLLYFGQRGFRVVAHDRRSHGRSAQTWDGNNMDQYADDLAELIETLDLKDVVLVGHSTGGGEVTHYVGRHGTSRIAGLVLLEAVPPLMLKTAANPNGTPIEAFDDIRKGVFGNRSEYYRDLTMPFYGFNREGAQVSEGLRESFWLMSMMGGIKGQYDCIHEFSEVDYSDDLRRVDVPTLMIHSTDDQIVPIDAAARAGIKLVPGAVLKEYEGGNHGIAQTDPDRVNADILDFIQSAAAATKPFILAEPTPA
jgi:non-heme chloroperoxidase